MKCDSLWVHVRLATFDGASHDADPYGVIEDGAIAIADGRIAWLGRTGERPPGLAPAAVFDGAGAWVTPGLIDCHTHLVYAGNRAGEFEARLAGADYASIARQGGGIRATVRATRQAAVEDLVHASAPRLRRLVDEGVTTIEVKSGYGLERDSELRMLAAAQQLAAGLPVSVAPTLLAAHAVPPEFDGRADAYIEYVVREILPAAARLRSAEAVDAFCETIAFTPGQVARVFDAAQEIGLPVKLHADQLSDSGGAELAARYGALSADHLEYASAAGVRALAAAGTVAVLLPGAFYFLRETRLPPIEALRRAGVPMALATDCNPGSSPCTSLLLMLNMACTLFRLTPYEALAGITRHAAQALGKFDRGRLAVGLRADFVLWDIEHPRDLCYAMGANPRVATVFEGISYRGDESAPLKRFG